MVLIKVNSRSSKTCMETFKEKREQHQVLELEMCHGTWWNWVKQEFYLLSAMETAKKNQISGEILHAGKCTRGPSEWEGGSNDTEIPLLCFASTMPYSWHCKNCKLWIIVKSSEGSEKILNKKERLAEQSVLSVPTLLLQSQPAPSWNRAVQTLHQLFLVLRKASLLPALPACGSAVLPLAWLIALSLPCQAAHESFPHWAQAGVSQREYPLSLPVQVPPALSLQVLPLLLFSHVQWSQATSTLCVTAVSGISFIVIYNLSYTHGKLCLEHFVCV